MGVGVVGVGFCIEGVSKINDVLVLVLLGMMLMLM